MNKNIVQQRGGFTLLEILAAVFILITAAGLALTAVASVGKATSRISTRHAAHQEAAGVLERLSVVPFEKLDEAAKGISPCETFSKRVKDPRIAVAVTDESEPPKGTRATRVVVTVDWTGSEGQAVRLTSWRFAPERKGTKKDEPEAEPKDEAKSEAKTEPKAEPKDEAETKPAEEAMEETPDAPKEESSPEPETEKEEETP